MYWVVLLDAGRVPNCFGVVVSGHDGQDFAELWNDIEGGVERVQALARSEGGCVIVWI